MLNSITLQGRFCRDPELRRTSSGTAVCSFSLAVEQDVKGQDGTRGVDFIDCVAWRGAADNISKYFKKGSMVVVRGRLSVRSWTDNDGNRRKSVEVLVDNAYFCGGRETASPAPAPAHGAQPPAPGDFAELEDVDGEFPF